MLYVLAGLGIFLAVTWGWRRYKTSGLAMQRTIALQAAGWCMLALSMVVGARGSVWGAFALATAGSWLASGKGLPPWLGGPAQQGGADGASSRVVTDHLEMVLDHATGAMRGRVLKGVFAGRQIDRLAPAELALLWRDCRFADPKSATLVEAWLDRTHPTWREDMARAEGEPGAGGIMTRREAIEILGVADGASDEEIRRAHRELMKRMHPDAGGSGYLAAKINEAKELLLKK